jgi:hypothetical protein
MSADALQHAAAAKEWRAMRFADIDFGPDDAKGDKRLGEYFLRIPEYDRVRVGKAWFIVGRKGTGKSAICQMLAQEARADPTRFASRLSFKDAPTDALFASADTRFTSRNQFISVWKFVMALEAAKLGLERDQSLQPRAREALERFLRENFGAVDVASLDAVSVLRQRGWKLGLPLPILEHLSAEVGRTTTDASSHQIHYAHAADAILKLFAKTGSTNTYLLLFDELEDDGQIPRYTDAVMSLLKAAYQVRNEPGEQGPRLWPVIVVREDVYLRLDDPDLNKLDDYAVRLRWSQDASPTARFSLKQVVEERLRASKWPPRAGSNATALWGSAVMDERWRNGAWPWLVDRTMLRPRDAIKFLKLAQREEEGTQLSPEAALRADASYSEWFYAEVGNEIYAALPVWREALGLLTRVTRPFLLSDYEREAASEPRVASLGTERTLQSLFDYGVIGMVHGNLRPQFKYTNPQLTFDPNSSFVAHSALKKHLKIRPQGSRVVLKEPADPDVRFH